MHFFLLCVVLTLRSLKLSALISVGLCWIPNHCCFFQLCPRAVAPNVLTFVGFLMTAGNFVLLTAFDYYYYAASDQPPGDKYAPIPNWIWFVMALNHFLAHTLGKMLK